MSDDMPEIGRQAAHAFLDMVSAWDDSMGEHDRNVAAVNLAAERFDQIGALSVTVEDDGSIAIDVSNLLGPAAVVLRWLVAQVAQYACVTPEHVIANAREFLDQE